MNESPAIAGSPPARRDPGRRLVVTPFDTVEDVIRLTNDSEYGLSAGLFTRDLQAALEFVH